MVSNLIFYACLELQFLDLETNPGPWHPVPGACKAFPGSWVTWQWLYSNTIYCCAETWTRTGVMYQFLHLVDLSCAKMRWLGLVGWLQMCEMDMGYIANLNLSVVVTKCWYLGCVVLDRTSLCSICIEPWSRWLDLLVYTNSNGCCVVSGCACLISVYEWLEWPSSGMVGFYHLGPLWCCGSRLFNGIILWSTGEWPYLCMWRNLQLASTLVKYLELWQSSWEIECAFVSASSTFSSN